MATKLTTENVSTIENKLLDGVDLWEEDAEKAKMILTYVAGVHDMANAVRKAIFELGGK